jgi:hypothetical protein
MKGAEIYIRMYGGSGWGTWRGRMMNLPIGEAAQNMIWVITSNNATDKGPDDPSKSMWGSSQIIDPVGNVAVRSNTVREEILVHSIPIADFRRPGKDNPNNFDYYFGNPHLPPHYYRGGLRTHDFLIKEYERFPPQFPPNLFTEYQKTHDGQLPPTYCDAREWYFKHRRWESEYLEAGKDLCPGR